MQKVFDLAVRGQEAAGHLPSLHQGFSSVAELAFAFQTLSAESGWLFLSQLANSP